MNRGDIKQAYARAVRHGVPDVADMLFKLAERINQVEKQLWHEQNLSFRNQLNETQVRLAASQAREAKLRKALEVVISFAMSDACVGDTDDLCYEFRMAANALSVSPDDDALRGMIERAGELMRQRSLRVAWDIEPDDNGPIESGISALPGVTLGDLK